MKTFALALIFSAAQGFLQPTYRQPTQSYQKTREPSRKTNYADYAPVSQGHYNSYEEPYHYEEPHYDHYDEPSYKKPSYKKPSYKK